LNVGEVLSVRDGIDAVVVPSIGTHVQLRGQLQLQWRNHVKLFSEEEQQQQRQKLKLPLGMHCFSFCGL